MGGGEERIFGGIGQESWMCERMAALIYFIALQGHELDERHGHAD